MNIEICETPDRKNLPKKIVQLWKQPNQNGNGVWLFLGDNGIVYHLGKYSEFLGMQRRGLRQRINKFGKDEPRILLRVFKMKGCATNRGTKEWQKLKTTPRDYKLNKIKTGKLERNIACPPAASGKYNHENDIGKQKTRRKKPVSFEKSYKSDLAKLAVANARLKCRDNWRPVHKEEAYI